MLLFKLTKSVYFLCPAHLLVEPLLKLLLRVEFFLLFLLFLVRILAILEEEKFRLHLFRFNSEWMIHGLLVDREIDLT